ncbi:hypothetical protein B0I35DRAFT_472896 [Stachybotrys elegans]|uniref:Uncharacterized protein n=1 Tax=Stachybotrys elegans TaxID=80388 RepID=A0A8K0T3G6_9HYPO|nr:hypothetical protein B0I35DRAFT_472896 [Stachybotrys elegans]
MASTPNQKDTASNSVPQPRGSKTTDSDAASISSNSPLLPRQPKPATKSDAELDKDRLMKQAMKSQIRFNM